ncbi:MAG TPA: CopD family protein [Casimicrobiaceae bacterium]|nr:CopD family protein [Casimicrobiaceae bacterium]
MSTLFDIFGFASVLLEGLDRVAQTVLIGSALFALVFAPAHPAREDAIDAGATIRIVRASALALVVTSLLLTLFNALILGSSLELSPALIAGARFVTGGATRVVAAILILVIAGYPRPWSIAVRVALIALCALILMESAAGSHAAARLVDSAAMYAATFAHQLGAALWLGGLPAFRGELLRRRGQDAAMLGRRYSIVSIIGVLLVVAGAVGFAVDYIGSLQGAYGTAYGVMAIGKAILLGLLLLLGLHNFITFRRTGADADAIARVRRIVAVEMGVAFAAVMAAGSITSTPPAVDLQQDRVTLSELAMRWRPLLPRFESPDHASLMLPALQAQLDAQWRHRQDSARPLAFVPGAGAVAPRNASDVAWSEYNHHWAGLLVFAMGVAALLARAGVPWARHWPLLFLGLAVFVFLRGDPEVWPLGEVGFFASLKDPEVVQHRVFVLIMVAFALFEWRVQRGGDASPRAALVFPMLVAIGGTLLLTHSHALGNVKEELMVETSHLPIAVLGVVAGWSRWLEVQAPKARDGRIGAWLWPVCFIVIGALLLNYREA